MESVLLSLLTRQNTFLTVLSGGFRTYTPQVILMVVTCNHHLLLQKTNNTKLCVFASTNEKTSTTPSETDAPPFVDFARVHNHSGLFRCSPRRGPAERLFQGIVRQGIRPGYPTAIPPHPLPATATAHRNRVAESRTTPPPWRNLHLLRKRTRLGNRSILLWLKILLLRPEHLVERRSHE